MKTVGRTFPAKKPTPMREPQGSAGTEAAKASGAEPKPKTPKKGT